MPKVRRLSVDPYLKRMRGKTPRSRSVPVARGAVVDVRKSSFTVRGIVVGVIPPTDFSRAYGRQVMVCDMKGREPHIWEVGAGDAIVRGRVKKIPLACAEAVAEYKRDNDDFKPRQRRRRS